jgi:hypothetical protein
MGSFILFSIGLLTICIQKTAHTCSSGVDAGVSGVCWKSHKAWQLEGGKYNSSNCVLQHCSNVLYLLQFPAEPKCARKRKG